MMLTRLLRAALQIALGLGLGLGLLESVLRINPSLLLRGMAAPSPIDAPLTAGDYTVRYSDGDLFFWHGNLIRPLAPGQDQVVAQVHFVTDEFGFLNAGTNYFLRDALGSVRQLANATGIVTLAKSYEPFGQTLSSSGFGTSNFSYTSEYLDPSGLYYLRARYFNSRRGRFIQADTWQGDYANPQSQNLWAYAEGNPTNLTDPTGHRAQGPGTDICLFGTWIYDPLTGSVQWVCLVPGAPTPPPSPNPLPLPFPPLDNWWTCTSQAQGRDKRKKEADYRTAHYRAIDEMELTVVLVTGTYGSSPSASGKYFSFYEKDARHFGKSDFNRGHRMTITRITVPHSFVENGYQFYDKGGGGSSIRYPEEVLPELYEVMTPIEILGRP
jgi:RHS repeat-associated protein